MRSISRAVSKAIGIPATVSANACALSGTLLAIIKLTLRLLSTFATRLAASPVPINSTVLFLRSSKYSSARFTAIDAIETLPLFIPVAVLILLPAFRALSNKTDRLALA
jgi:hypothetical protein